MNVKLSDLEAVAWSQYVQGKTPREAAEKCDFEIGQRIVAKEMTVTPLGDDVWKIVVTFGREEPADGE